MKIDMQLPDTLSRDEIGLCIGCANRAIAFVLAHGSDDQGWSEKKYEVQPDGLDVLVTVRIQYRDGNFRTFCSLEQETVLVDDLTEAIA